MRKAQRQMGAHREVRGPTRLDDEPLSVIREAYHIGGVETRLTIKSFKEKKTERLFEHGICPSEWKSFQRVAERKLDMLDAAEVLTDLGSPPGNRLEALRGNRRGQYSIRINDQYRLCFRWTEEGPEEVEIVDYH